MSTTVQFTEKLLDQAARDKFAEEIDTNFSVIAPAGVGKTTAIVQRIVRIAARCDDQIFPSMFSKLVVVTYTQKAADEMRIRTHQALLKENVSSQWLQEFNNVFFGTIHSFCLKLIQSYGAHIGVPSNADLLVNDEDIWQEFLNLNRNFENLIPTAIKDDLCKYINLSELIELARKISPGSVPQNTLSICPKVDLAPVFNHNSKRSKKVVEIQKELKRWLKTHQEQSFALGIPEMGQGDSEFKELCARAFSPLWHWLGDAAHIFVVNLAKEYQNFRISKGLISYDDMIDLAVKLVKDSDVATTIRSFDYHVILDEAQDTDAKQFGVLLNVVQVDNRSIPLGGRFCMLGDPQQAIYSSRADLPTYLKIHKDLSFSSGAETLTLNVTMRCDRAIVDHCNSLFPNILRNKNTVAQINFVPLNARPWAGEGYVGKIKLEYPENEAGKLKTNDLEKYEAKLLANKIKSLGLDGLGINDWSDLALLTPRKSWLMPIAKALQDLGIPVQIHSRNDTKGDNPAFAWVCALVIIMARPNDSFEIMGVLREIFGLSDHAIANYVHWWDSNKSAAHPLNIGSLDRLQCNDPVGKTLKFLYELRRELLKCSLTEALRKLLDRVELRHRLHSLPQYDHENLSDMLDKILIQATILEEQGCSLAEFAVHLEKDYQSLDEPMEELKGHVQGITSHKAKGLEWPVVIVPFMFRSILFPPQEYPQWINVGSDYAPKIALFNHPDKKKYDELLEQYRIAELERLLYVTATRACRGLIWVDDEELFKNPSISFAALLNVTIGKKERQIWDSLEVLAPEFANRSINYVQDSLKEIKLKEGFELFNVLQITEARKYSQMRFQCIVPSQLKKEVKLEDLSRFHSQETRHYSSVEYGNWWHSMMESLPWKVSSQWKVHLLQFMSKCPEPARGHQEFDLFLKSNWLKSLLNSNLRIKTEVPFLYQKENKSYEGFIDFFAYCEERKIGVIIDWKTDFFDFSGQGWDILQKMYSGQLAVYKEAVEKVFKAKVQTFLYSTSIGEFCECRF